MTAEGNLDFQIQWCETNLRFLADEPPGAARDQAITFMFAEINRLNLERLKAEKETYDIEDPQ